MTAMKLAFALSFALLTGCVGVDLEDDMSADTGHAASPRERCEEMVECGVLACDEEIQAAQACISDPFCSLDPKVDELYADREECFMMNGCWLVDCASAEMCDGEENEVLNQALLGMVESTVAPCSSL